MVKPDKSGASTEIRTVAVQYALQALSVSGSGPTAAGDVVRAADTIAKFIADGTVPTDQQTLVPDART